MRILYIDIDSMRPDHLSCYGYHRQTSPNIDALADEGVRFNNFYCSDSPCLPSRTAFFTGMFGAHSGVVNHGGVYADLALEGPTRAFRGTVAMESFASTLRNAGYHTASISPFPNRHTAYQVWYGFTETYDTGKGGQENADEMYPPAKRWLEANGQDDNWFLHLNMWDPHTPYDHPEEFGNPFADEPIEDWITQDLIDAQNASFGPHSATEVPGYGDELPPRWTMGVGAIRTLDDARRTWTATTRASAMPTTTSARLSGISRIWVSTRRRPSLSVPTMARTRGNSTFGVITRQPIRVPTASRWWFAGPA